CCPFPAKCAHHDRLISRVQSNIKNSPEATVQRLRLWSPSPALGKAKRPMLGLRLQWDRKTRATWRNPRKCPLLDVRLPQQQTAGRLSRKRPACRRGLTLLDHERRSKSRPVHVASAGLGAKG